MADRKAWLDLLDSMQVVLRSLEPSKFLSNWSPAVSDIFKVIAWYATTVSEMIWSALISCHLVLNKRLHCSIHYIVYLNVKVVKMHWFDFFMNFIYLFRLCWNCCHSPGWSEDCRKAHISPACGQYPGPPAKGTAEGEEQREPARQEWIPTAGQGLRQELLWHRSVWCSWVSIKNKHLQKAPSSHCKFLFGILVLC